MQGSLGKNQHHPYRRAEEAASLTILGNYQITSLVALPSWVCRFEIWLCKEELHPFPFILKCVVTQGLGPMGDATDIKESSFNSCKLNINATSPKTPSLSPDSTQACEFQNNRDWAPQLQYNFLSVIKYGDFRRSPPELKPGKERRADYNVEAKNLPHRPILSPYQPFCTFFFSDIHHKIAARLSGREK